MSHPQADASPSTDHPPPHQCDGAGRDGCIVCTPLTEAQEALRRRVSRLINQVTVCYFVLAYVLYLGASWLPLPTALTEVIAALEICLPRLGSIRMAAAQFGESAIPMQLVMIHCALMTVAIWVGAVFLYVRHPGLARVQIRHLFTKDPPRPTDYKGLMRFGMFYLTAAMAMFYLMFFMEPSNAQKGKELLLSGPSLLSATCLALASLCTAFVALIALWMLYMGRTIRLIFKEI